MKRNAFTLVEIVFCIIVIGFVYLIVISNVNIKGFKQKETLVQAHKAVSAIEEASAKIRNDDSENCPNGTFIENIAGEEEFSFYNDEGNAPSSQDVIDIYSKYLKFTKKDFDFCEFTAYCESAKISKGIKGAKLVGDVIIGVEVFEKLQDCPNYYNIDTKEVLEGKNKCWGKLYIDTNGLKAPNAFNEDVFIFGLDKDGIQI